MSSSSGFFSATGQVIAAGPGPACYGIQCFGDGTHASTVTVYSGTGAVSGNEIFKASFPASVVSPQQIVFNYPICTSGIYVSLTGTGATGVLLWDGGA